MRRLVATVLCLSFACPAYAGGPGQVVGILNQQFNGQVSVAGQTDGQVLTWQASTGSWVAASAAGGGVTSLAATSPIAVDASTGAVTVSISATPTFTSASLSATSNQLTLQSAGVTGKITWTPTSTNKTITLPDITGTVALLGGGQTFTSAVWNGTAISEAYGGTNQTTYTAGDTIYASASNTLSKRAIGSAGQVLTVSGGVPTWATPASGVTSITGTANQVIASASTGAVTLSLPQSIATSSAVTFGAETLGGVLNWATGLGAINHITGPTDQPLALASGASGKDISLTTTGVSHILLTSGDTSTVNAAGYVTKFGAGVNLGSNNPLYFCGDTSALVPETEIARYGAGVLQLDRGTSNTTWIQMNTFTNTSNWEGLNMAWVANAMNITTDARGSGSFRDLKIGLGGAANLYLGGFGAGGQYWIIGSNGFMLAPNDNICDVGQTSSYRPRTLYVGTSVVSPVLNLTATSNQLVLQSAGVTGTLTWTPASSNKTITLPNITGTVALLGGGQTFTSALWNGTAIAEAYGGTNQTTYTTGDLLYASASNTLSKLAAGTATYVLTANGAGTAPSWQAPSVLTLGTLAVTANGTTCSSSYGVYLCNAAGGDFTITLPTASGVTGRCYTVKNTTPTPASSGACTVTVATTGGQTVDGLSTINVQNPRECLQFVSDGSNWVTIGIRYPLGSTASYYLTSDQTISTSTVTALSGWTVKVNTQQNGANFYTGGSPTRFTFPVGGTYVVALSVDHQSNAVGTRTARLHLNGSVYANAIGAATAANDTTVPIATNLTVTAGDYLEVNAYQDSGGNLSVKGGTGSGSGGTTWISITRINGQ